VLCYKNANPNPNPNYCCSLQQVNEINVGQINIGFVDDVADNRPGKGAEKRIGRI